MQYKLRSWFTCLRRGDLEKRYGEQLSWKVDLVFNQPDLGKRGILPSLTRKN